MAKVPVVKRAGEHGVAFIKPRFSDLSGFVESLGTTVDEGENTRKKSWSRTRG